MYQFSYQFTYANLAIRTIAIIVVLVIVNRWTNPANKLSWTFIILLSPVLGLLLYMIFGRSSLTKKTQERMDSVNREVSACLYQTPEIKEQLEREDLSVYRQSRYINDWAGFPLYHNTSTKYYSCGEEMFPDMLADLEKAEHFIFLEYFIIHEGKMWNSILEILEQKVKEGVDVRLIYDDMGCLTTLPHKYYETMRSKGIKCQVFNPFRPILNIIQNNRDHRKLCIIDGWVGFTGGINLADEYINQKERFGHWKDTAVMLKGEAVWNMTVMFLHMWAVIGRSEESIDYEAYFPHRYHEEEFESDGFVQPFCDTPLDEEVVGEDVYLNIINKAKKYVYICTPYLIIDNEMMTALCLAAKSGVDVRIMTPGIPDKKLVFILTQSYYRQLLEAGVKIYEYQPGFLHAKSFVSDDEIGVVGTINLDYRSLYLHFEDGVWIYRNRVIQDIKDDFIQTMEYCRQIKPEFCLNRNIGLRIMQNIFRAFAPLM